VARAACPLSLWRLTASRGSRLSQREVRRASVEMGVCSIGNVSIGSAWPRSTLASTGMPEQRFDPERGPQRLDLFRGVTDRAAKHQSTDLVEDAELFEVGEVGIHSRGRRSLFGVSRKQDRARGDQARTPNL